MIEKIIDVDRYPLLDLESDSARQQIKEWEDIFNSEGICVLEGFIRPSYLKQVVHEVSAIQDEAFFKAVVGNAYLDDIDETLPPDHARRMTDTTHLGAIANDQIPQESIMKTVYLSPKVTQFIQAIINRGPVYHYACPLGALNYTVMKEGDKLRWHFDQSDFVVSIPLQDAEHGGYFEYVHNIRSQQDENYERVKKLLEGDSENVQRAVTPPGSLVLFQGRYTIHRVTEIKGATPRLGALLGYADRPDVNSSEYLKEIRYGRIQ